MDTNTYRAPHIARSSSRHLYWTKTKTQIHIGHLIENVFIPWCPVHNTYVCSLCITKLEETALNPGRTDCIGLTHELDLWLDLQSLRAIAMAYLHAKNSRSMITQSVPKIEWKQTDLQMERQTDRCDCITSHANAVGNKLNDWITVFNKVHVNNTKNSIRLHIHSNCPSPWSL